jgi:hypothetical protein
VSLDFSRCRLTPFNHQREDAQFVVDHPFCFIASEMRTGKTKIVIDASQFMFEAGTIDRVIVVAPQPVRDVWRDEQFGELKKHLWRDLSAEVIEYHARTRSWTWDEGSSLQRQMQWIVTNYEFLRSDKRLSELLGVCNNKTLIVGDESSYLKNADAAQTEAFKELRWKCGRVILMNGTPISHSPRDLFSQGNLLHPSILECKYITHFLARYAIQEPVLTRGGKPLTKVVRGGKEIVIQHTAGWRPEGIEDLQRRFAPYTIRRLQKDCLDLPPKLDTVPLTTTLEKETWKAYRDMRDDLVVWLNTSVATATTAAIKVMRLSQITSGYLGGVEDAPTDDGLWEDTYFGGDDADLFGHSDHDSGRGGDGGVVRDPTNAETPARPEGIHDHDRTATIGREKLDVTLDFVELKLEANPTLHAVLWCRFKPEAVRLVDELKKKFPKADVSGLWGGQKKAERAWALSLLHPDTADRTTPAFVVGTFGTGSFGLNFAAATMSINVSSGYSLGKATQSGDRIYGPGMIGPASYFDVLAVGPKGQKTIDHVILEARMANKTIADWTASAWVQELTKE